MSSLPRFASPLHLASWAGLLATACALPDEAAEEVLTETPPLWRGAIEASDEALQNSLRVLLQGIDPEALVDGDLRSTPNQLEAADLATLEFYAPDGTPTPPPDASLTSPAALTERYGCTIAELLPIVLYAQQDELYGSVRSGGSPYESYTRTYLTSLDDFLSGAASSVQWRGQLVSDIPIAGPYTYDFRADARLVPVPPELGLPEPNFLITRTWLPHPAAWNDPYRFEQDYQLEVFVPWGAGEVVHYYPVWRQWNTPLGGMDNGTVVKIALDQMAEWGKNTERLCDGEGLRP